MGTRLSKVFQIAGNQADSGAFLGAVAPLILRGATTGADVSLKGAQEGSIDAGTEQTKQTTEFDKENQPFVMNNLILKNQDLTNKIIDDDQRSELLDINIEEAKLGLKRLNADIAFESDPVIKQIKIRELIAEMEGAEQDVDLNKLKIESFRSLFSPELLRSIISELLKPPTDVLGNPLDLTDDQQKQRQQSITAIEGIAKERGIQLAPNLTTRDREPIKPADVGSNDDSRQGDVKKFAEGMGYD